MWMMWMWWMWMWMWWMCDIHFPDATASILCLFNRIFVHCFFKQARTFEKTACFYVMHPPKTADFIVVKVVNRSQRQPG